MTLINRSLIACTVYLPAIVIKKKIIVFLCFFIHHKGFLP